MGEEQAAARTVAGPVLGIGAVLVVGGLAAWAIWGRGGTEAPAQSPEIATAAQSQGTEQATAQLAPEAAPEAAAEPAATAGTTAAAGTEPAPAASLPPDPPRFDVVRVDAGGLATIAGSAPAGSVVALRLDGAELARAAADGAGQFATLLTIPPADVPRLLSLVAILPDGRELPGLETVALSAFAPPAPATAEAGEPTPVEPAPVDSTAADAPAMAQAAEPAAPAALLLTPEGATVLQEPAVASAAPETTAAETTAAQTTAAEAPAPMAISIDTISYGDAGEVLLVGKAEGGAALRIYLDDQALAEVTADGAGKWAARLDDVSDGLHRLRADQISPLGDVLSRFETPFKRELPPAQVAAVAAEPAAPAAAPADAAPAPTPAPITITVQPGMTLWAIARENFGQGVMYVQVFEVNRDKIKDPNLIYPGQVFTIPKP
ncbi:MAG: LysM peptidoglycan-binding domain-containing protein [Rhodobacteraceae bacterium]|nr:LysM peptidoglycan-binding domain-containing protein [Paracoccaceae bacterium]